MLESLRVDILLSDQIFRWKTNVFSVNIFSRNTQYQCIPDLKHKSGHNYVSYKMHVLLQFNGILSAS